MQPRRRLAVLVPEVQQVGVALRHRALRRPHRLHAGDVGGVGGAAAAQGAVASVELALEAGGEGAQQA